MKKYSILICVFALSLYSCNKNKKARVDNPEIVFTGITHDRIANGSLKDTVLISLRYTMAADAVGTVDTPTQVILKDSRDQTNQALTFPAQVQSKVPDGEVNISGNITVALSGRDFFIGRPTKPDGDTLFYSIYLEDKYSKQSNIVTTPEIYILP